METLSLVLIDIEEALRQPGCPLCRCCLKAETRYLRFLLWENVNDMGTRMRLVQSLGFCGRHGRQMLQMEVTDWAIPLGNSLIYEGLTKQALRKLQDIRALVAKQMRQGWKEKLLARVAAKSQGERRCRSLLPEKGCRVCEVGDETAQYRGETLVQMLAYKPFQELYAQSDGVCLPHLRMILRSASLESGLQYLLDDAEQRLMRLENDLREFARKQSYQYREEPVSESERTAAERAVAFFGGLEVAAVSLCTTVELGEESFKDSW